MKEKQIKSYAMLISSMLIFGTIGIFRKYIPISSALLACTRGITGSLFLIILSVITRHKFEKIKPKQLLLLVLSGALIGLNWIFLFEAYEFTTVATATMCYYMQPTIVMLLSPLILKDKLRGKNIICIVISLIGMFCVSGMADGIIASVNSPEISEEVLMVNSPEVSNGNLFDFASKLFSQYLGTSQVKGVLFGLVAAILYAFVIILNKMLRVEDAYSKTIVQLLCASLVLLPFLIGTEKWTAVPMNGFMIVMILIVGLLHTGIAYALYFGSMKNLKAGSIAILSYIDPVFAFILSAAVLKEETTVFGIIGAIMIIGAAILSESSFPGIKFEKEKNKMI